MALIDEFSDTGLERQLLSALLQSQEDVHAYFERLRPSYFTDENLRRVFVYVSQLLENIGSIPTEETLRLELQSKFPRAKETVEALLTAFTVLRTVVVRSPISFLLEKVVSFARAREMLLGMEKSISLLEEGKIEESLRIYQEGALALYTTDPITPVVRGEVSEDFEDRRRLYEDKKRHPEKYRGILTGLPELDKITGGLWKGELGFVFGKSGVGKSFGLLFFAYAAFMQGYKVLVMPIEMPYHQWAYRFDSRMTHIEYTKFKWADLSEEQFRQWGEKSDQVKSTYYDKGGRLFISHIPLGCTVGAIKAELEYFKKTGTSIDLLVLDYADLVVPPRQQYSEQAELTSIFRTLKGFAQLYNIPVWTATQMRRDSYQKDSIDITDVGFAAGKAHISDLVVGMQRTDADMQRGIMKLHIVKYRDGTYNTPIILRPNLALATIDTTGIT